ncbi:SEFIR domain-containing protein [Pseudomonas subflava]|uniref:SEFIR domain-containing protein n=1 Tax=Pseudomonas subflava TaxID=2952933 RepID=UPI00207A1B8F|nr:SEFIR domain-containing protein [Pseudomonas subflava]
MSEVKSPKVFISYSWSGIDHQEFVKECAERLVSDGIEVVLDIFDLREGDDKYAFMESMVTDDTVTHVLIMSDKAYAEKADARKAGVGTESQIISKHVYEKVAQSKFIPIICERDSEGRAITPTFLQSRISIDFSSPEKVNENWERLVRLLFGRPEHTKPQLGKPPAYITGEAPVSAAAISAKFNTLKQAILQEKKRISHYRRDLIDECVKHADKFRIREQKQITGEMVLGDLRALKPVRDYLLEWVLLESDYDASNEFNEALTSTLEKLLELKSRPEEITQWNDNMLEAQRVFVYETFLYIVAALIKTKSFESLHEVFFTSYLLPDTEGYGENRFDDFTRFYGYSETLQILAEPGRKLSSPAAAYIKQSADRESISFRSIMEAETLILMIAFMKQIRWFPQTLYYAGYHGKFELFNRAQFKKHYKNIATITGYEDPRALELEVRLGHDQARPNNWNNFYMINFLELMNIQELGKY